MNLSETDLIIFFEDLPLNQTLQASSFFVLQRVSTNDKAIANFKAHKAQFFTYQDEMT